MNLLQALIGLILRLLFVIVIGGLGVAVLMIGFISWVLDNFVKDLLNRGE